MLIRAVHTAEMQTPTGVLPATGNPIAITSAEYIEIDDAGRIICPGATKTPANSWHDSNSKPQPENP